MRRATAALLVLAFAASSARAGALTELPAVPASFAPAEWAAAVGPSLADGGREDSAWAALRAADLSTPEGLGAVRELGAALEANKLTPKTFSALDDADRRRVLARSVDGVVARTRQEARETARLAIRSAPSREATSRTLERLREARVAWAAYLKPSDVDRLIAAEGALTRGSSPPMLREEEALESRPQGPAAELTPEQLRDYLSLFAPVAEEGSPQDYVRRLAVRGNDGAMLERLAARPEAHVELTAAVRLGFASVVDSGLSRRARADLAEAVAARFSEILNRIRLDPRIEARARAAAGKARSALRDLSDLMVQALKLPQPERARAGSAKRAAP